MANPQDRADFSTWFVADRSHVESDCVLTDVCCAHAHYTVWRDILLILLSFSLLVDGHQYMNHHSSLSSRQRQLLDSFFGVLRNQRHSLRDVVIFVGVASGGHM